jgi:hypothetical protein
MRCNIIGCGPTGAHWDGSGYSIGVNDCWKFGHPTDCLVVVNSFRELPSRYSLIVNSTPKDGFYSSLSSWSRHPNYKQISLRPYSGGDVSIQGRPEVLVHTRTSPLIAMHLAAKKGYTDLVLYGVDFADHPHVHGAELDREKKMYLKFIAALEKLGVRVYLYQKYGAFSDHIPVYYK